MLRYILILAFQDQDVVSKRPEYILKTFERFSSFKPGDDLRRSRLPHVAEFYVYRGNGLCVQ